MAKKEYKLTEEQYRSLECVTELCILDFPHIAKKGTYKCEETKYGGTFLFKKTEGCTMKDDPVIAKIRTILAQAKIYEFGPDQKKWPQNDPKKKPYWRKGIADGDESENKNFAGFWVISAGQNEKERFGKVYRDGTPVEDENLEKVFPDGAIVRANIQAGVYELSKTNMGETLYLKAIKKVKDGPRRGGRNFAKAFEGFDDSAEGEDDESNYEKSFSDEDESEEEYVF